MTPRVSRTVLVAGAAHGIGAASARRLTKAGVHVIGLDRVELNEWEVADSTVMERRVGDVGNVSWVADEVERGSAGHDLDGLLYCVAVQSPARAEDTTVPGWRHVMEVNAESAWTTATAFVRLARRPAGIVLVSSILGQRTGQGAFAYSASKAALEAVGRSLAVEYGPMGIRTNVIAPGFISVSRNSHRLESRAKSDRVRASNPLGLIGQADDVAAAAAFLLSPEARFINGIILPVDGGERIGTPPFGLGQGEGA